MRTSLNFAILLISLSAACAQETSKFRRVKKSQLQNLTTYMVAGNSDWKAYFMRTGKLVFCEWGSKCTKLRNVSDFKISNDSIYLNQPINLDFASKDTSRRTTKTLINFIEKGNVSVLVPQELIYEYEQFKSTKYQILLDQHKEELNFLDSILNLQTPPHKSVYEELDRIYLEPFHFSELELLIGIKDPNNH